MTHLKLYALQLHRLFQWPTGGARVQKKNHTEERTAAWEITEHGDGNGKVKTV